MTSTLFAFLGVCFVLGARAYDSALFEDELFRDLYKRLTQIDKTYYPADDMSYAGGSPYWDGVIPLDARDSGQTDIRDPEFLAHGAIGDGFQYISGGAGEGKQHLKPDGTLDNPQEVKSDDVLPFYCHPPNPCPKGFKAADGCQENVKDDAEVQKEWIAQMQAKGMCTCDEEHMFDCGAQNGMEDNRLPDTDSMGDNNLDDFITSMLADNKLNPYADGDKVMGVVAKKSPRIKRSAELKSTNKKNSNPYLQGTKIHIVAKKGFNMN